jgi:hypothetical protein
MNVRRMAKRPQLLGNPKCPIAITARIADENIGHATVLCMEAAEPSRINSHLLAGAADRFAIFL